MRNNKIILKLIVLLLLITAYINGKENNSGKKGIINLQEKKSSCNIDSTKSYTKYITNIKDDTLHLRDDLIYDKKFKNALNNPKEVLSQVKKILSCKQISYDKKFVSLMSMSSLDLGGRIELLESCYESFKKNNLSLKLLKISISMYYYFYRENPIYINYDNENLVKLLNQIKSEKRVDKAFQENISEILSGKEYRVLIHRIETNDYLDPKTRLDIPKK